MAAAAAGSSRLLPALAFAGVVFFLLVADPGVVAGEAAATPPGLEFHVGGPRGWRVPDTNTSYGWWAMNNRFHVGDRLYFKYANDSVLVVDRLAFDACNASAPLAAFAGGATEFRLHRPGFFCFISGEPGHCEEGQRLIVRVMVHPAALAAAPAPGPGAPTTTRPGTPSGCSDAASSAVDAAIAAAAGVAMATLVGLGLMLH